MSKKPIPYGDWSEKPHFLKVWLFAPRRGLERREKRVFFSAAQPWVLALQITKSALFFEIFISFASFSLFTSLANNGI